MNREVIWSPAAEEDLDKILDYLQHKWSLNVITKFIDKVDENIGLINEDPGIFPIINKDLQIRKSVITKHNTLYYREVNRKIEVIRLFDSRHDPKKLEF